MPMVKYARASIVHPGVGMSPERSFNRWQKVRKASRRDGNVSVDLIGQASEIFDAPFDPSKYLLTHATIVASVDVYQPPGVKLGSVVDEGFQVNRKYGDFRIKPESDRYINNNLDAWSRPVLLKSYKTFIGGHNFVEHVQIEDLSKGRIIDAAARDIGESVYVDILIATDRQHRDLVTALESGKMSTLSMGCTIDGSICTKCGHWAADETEMCFPPDTRVLLSDGTYRPIQDIVVGDLVITHTGATQPVTQVMSRHHHGDMTVLNVDGVTAPLSSTPKHPYWVLRPAQVCACGCGEPLDRTVEHRRGSVKAFQRRFRVGHNARIQNPNPRANNVASLQDYKALFDVDFEFVEAQDIHAGDYVGFPIPQETVVTPDATERKARLLGYFLAEGSYIKRGGVRVGVDFSFGYHEGDTLVQEVSDLLNAEFGRPERRTSAIKWEQRVAASSIKPVRRRSTSRPVPEDVQCPSCGAPSEYAYNARFKKAADDCYQCKVCGRSWVQSADRALQARINHCPIDGPDSGSITVRMMDTKVAQFFHKFCGEYSNEKRIHAEVMSWPAEIQRHVLNCWLNGDGNQSLLGVTGNTASFHLVSQMHVLAARCGLYARKTVLFGGKSVAHNQVVNGNGSVTLRDDRGWLPSFGLTLSDPAGFGSEPRFSDGEKARVTMSAISDSFKRVGNWLLYRVRGTSTETYCGKVHNLEVAEDHSYVVEGVAVHNCNHIKYEKGNVFFDSQGGQHRVAELCGHESLEPTGGVQFIEGSWVSTPAFTGAVMRNILEPSANLSRQAQKILSLPPKKWDADSRRKSATLGSSTDLVLGQWDDEDDAEDEGGAEKEPQSPFKGLEEDLTKHLLDRVKKRLQREMSQEDEEEALTPESPASDHPNDTLVKEGAGRVYQASLDSLVRTASSSARLIDGVARLNKSIGIDIPVQVYRAVLAAGPYDVQDPVPFLRACHRALGRRPSIVEAKTMVRLGKLISQREALLPRGENHPGIDQGDL